MVASALTSLALASTLAGGAPSTVSSTTPTAATATTSSSAAGHYIVKPGDTLWKISQSTGVQIATLEQANPSINPANLMVGENLTVPSSSGTSASSASISSGASMPSSTSTPSASTAEDHSVTALQQKLAELGYLPLTDTFQWKYTNIPPSLQYLCQPGSYNVMTKGAVMAFQSDAGLTTDGIAGAHTWVAIDKAVAQNALNTHGFSFVYVSDTEPFTLYLWHDGQYVLSSLANLGIPQSQTTTGVYPVYLQYQSQDMKGTNPNGTTYDDPGVPYVSYFYRGEAIHGFPRASYGSQQSLGCVELPFTAAQTAWSYIHIGTLVDIGN